MYCNYVEVFPTYSINMSNNEMLRFFFQSHYPTGMEIQQTYYDGDPETG